MIERYIDFLGLEETQKLLEANEKPLIPSIRVNTLKIKPLDLKEKLEKKGFKLEPIKLIPEGFKVVKSPRNLGSQHEYLQGYYYLQNEASMFPAQILNPKPDETIIDMCAAPGSKSTHLAQLMKNEGKLILIEKNEKRIPALETNIRRMGIKNSVVINLNAIEVGTLNIQAEKILLDAPCTGEGLIRQDKGRKKSKTLNDIKLLARVQKKLLAAGLKALKPGGHLVYSTCSIAPEENELVVNSVINNKDYSISKIVKQYGVKGLSEVFGETLNKDLEFTQRLYPHIHDTIGFFLCLIEN